MMIERINDVQLAQSREDREEAYRLRYSVYVRELGRALPGVDHGAQVITDDLDQSAALFISRRAGDLAGTIRINLGTQQLPEHLRAQYGLDRFAAFDPRVFSFASRLVVRPERRSSLVCLNLCKASYEYARRNGVIFNFCHCEPRLIDFYLRLGYRAYRQAFTDPELGLRIPLALVLDDIAHLSAVRSPFLDLARQYQNCAGHSDWFHQTFPALHVPTEAIRLKGFLEQ